MALKRKIKVLYAITAQVERTGQQGTYTRSLPVFYLDRDVQGIMDATHAELIAMDILHACGHGDDSYTLHICAERI